VVLDSFGHEVCVILSDCILWRLLVRAHTPNVYDRPLGLALFLCGSSRWGSLCYRSPFFQFFRCLGGVLFPVLGTFLWHTPLLLLCRLLTWLWLLRHSFIPDRCLNLPCINLLTCGHLLSENWNSPVILSIPDFHLYVFFLDAVLQL
jgi:hypothetical protein